MYLYCTYSTLDTSLTIENPTDLFIGGASSGHQVQVESSETQDRDKKQPWYTDDYQTVHTC